MFRLPWCGRAAFRSEAPLAILLLLFASPFAAADDAVWIGGASGIWSDPANWSTGVVPNSMLTYVTIDADPARDVRVTLDEIAQTPGLQVDAGDALQINAGISLYAGAATLEGELAIHGAGYLLMGGMLRIAPSGAVILDDSGATSNPQLRSNAPAILWNEGEIRGAGRILNLLPLVNFGQVVADQEGRALSLMRPPSNVATPVNASQLVAEGGGILSIDGPFYNSFGGVEGVIEARGDSRVMIRGNGSINGEAVGVVGGRFLTNSEGGDAEGRIEINGATLTDVSLDGQIEIFGGAVAGTIANQQQVTVRGTVIVAADTVLAGDGRMELNSASFRGPSSGRPPGTLVNEAGHTIAGSGTFDSFNARLINRGVIESLAVPPMQPLAINLSASNSFGGLPTVNSGVIRAAAGAELRFAPAGGNPVVQNFEGDLGGLIEADVNGTVRFDGATVEGGTIRGIAAPPDDPTAMAGRVIDLGGIADVRLEGLIAGRTFTPLLVSGVIDNRGRLSAYGLRLTGPTTLTGGGEVHVAPSTIETNANGQFRTLENEDNTITLGGSLVADYLQVTNRGTIQVEGETGSLFRSANPFIQLVNSGLLQATGGGRLELGLPVQNFEHGQLGEIHAADDSLVRVDRVAGGVLTTAGTGEIHILESLEDVHNQGQLELHNTSPLLLSGQIVNDGVMYVGSATAEFAGPLSRLDGVGLLTFNTSRQVMRVGHSNTPAVLIHGPDHTIQGWGRIGVTGTLINEGRIVAADDRSLSIDLDQGSHIQNLGALVVPASGEMTINLLVDRIANEGRIEVRSHLTLDRSSPGPLELTNAAGAVIQLDGFLTLISESDVESPTLLWNQAGGEIVATVGDVKLREGASMHTSELRNSGVIRTRPQSPLSGGGTLSTDADFVQSGTGLLEMTLASDSAGQFDVFYTTGAATLAGTFAVQLRNNFQPQSGDRIPLVTAEGGVTGQFDALQAPPLPGRKWFLDYEPTHVVLAVAALTADFDADGDVDGADLPTWQSGFGLTSGATYAQGDATGDGAVSGADFLAWQAEHGQGLAMDAAASVAEPAAGMLAALVCGILGAVRQRARTHRRAT